MNGHTHTYIRRAKTIQTIPFGGAYSVSLFSTLVVLIETKIVRRQQILLVSPDLPRYFVEEQKKFLVIFKERNGSVASAFYYPGPPIRSDCEWQKKM